MPSAKKPQPKKPSAAKVAKAKATVAPTPQKKNTPTKPVAKTPPKKIPAPVKKAKAAPKPVAKTPPKKNPAPAKKTTAAPQPVAKKTAAAPVVAKSAETRKEARPVKSAPVVPGPLTIRPFSRSAENKRAPDPVQSAKPPKLSAVELKKLRAELVALRNRLTAKTTVMRQVALERNDEINTEEDGIDQFDRLFEISKVASVQEFVYLIDEAFRALDDGVYGVCQKCAATIEKARIQALPFAKTCIRCQNEAERLKNR